MFIMNLFQTEAHPAKKKNTKNPWNEHYRGSALGPDDETLCESLLPRGTSRSPVLTFHKELLLFCKGKQRSFHRLHWCFIFLMSFAGFFSEGKASCGLSGSVFIKHPQSRKAVTNWTESLRLMHIWSRFLRLRGKHISSAFPKWAPSLPDIYEISGCYD